MRCHCITYLILERSFYHAHDPRQVILSDYLQIERKAMSDGLGVRGRRARQQPPVNVDLLEQWVRSGFTLILSARTGTFLDTRTRCETRSQKPRWPNVNPLMTPLLFHHWSKFFNTASYVLLWSGFAIISCLIPPLHQNLQRTDPPEHPEAAVSGTPCSGPCPPLNKFLLQVSPSLTFLW